MAAPVSPARPRLALICHHDAVLHTDGIVRWIHAFADVAAVVVVHEDRAVLRRRVQREFQRSGLWGFLDVLLFRLMYKVRGFPALDRAWEARTLESLRATYPAPASVPTVHVTSPNSAEAERFLRESRPDLTIALSRNMLAARIFEIPPAGTVVFHPGICPEYRNSHGCFWALVHRDLERVGMTVLRIDRGVDTGPVFGYFRVPLREQDETHIVLQGRVTLENLPGIRDLLLAMVADTATPIDTTGRASAAWGQPRWSAWRRWRRAAPWRGGR